MKTSSETESVATRSLDPGEEIDLAEEHTLKPYPIRDSGVLPSPCHERDLQRAPVKACCRSRQHLRSLPIGEAGAPPTVTFLAERIRTLAPVRFLSSRLPREH